jgi:hypothetical protein
VLRRLFKRRRREPKDIGLDAQTRAENEEYRAEHDGTIGGRAQYSADRWQRSTDAEFKRPR